MTQLLYQWLETPSQTAGPYVHIGCMPEFAGFSGNHPEALGKSAFTDGASGQKIEITGSVYDGTGWAIRDAMLETWQADASGIYAGQADADPHVSGFCRFAIDPHSGEFLLNTIKPGSVVTQDGWKMAPHISLWIAARGINIGLHTRIYFDDEDNSADPLLGRIEQRPRAETLIANKTGEGCYRFDVRLQGEAETIFLDL